MRGQGDDTRALEPQGKIAVAGAFFIPVIREGGDAYAELKSASSPVGGGEVDSSYFNSPINLIKRRR